MECPFCGKEMRQGYIPAGDVLRWLPTGEELFTASREDRVRLFYPLKNGSIDNGPEAYYCADCMRLIVSVPPQREALTQRLAKWKRERTEEKTEKAPTAQAEPVDVKKPKHKKNWDKDPWED